MVDEQAADKDQRGHGGRAMDLHQQAARDAGFPKHAREAQDAENRVEQRAGRRRKLSHGRRRASRNATSAPNRAASSRARFGSSMHGFVRASARVQSGATTVAPQAFA